MVVRIHPWELWKPDFTLGIPETLTKTIHENDSRKRFTKTTFLENRNARTRPILSQTS